MDKKRGRRGGRRNPLRIAAGALGVALLALVYVVAAPFVWLYGVLKRAGIGRKTVVYAVVIAAVMIVSVLVAVVIHSATKLNAVEVFLDGKRVGAVGDLSVTAEQLKDMAVLKAKAREDGADLLVNETVTVNKIHAKGRTEDMEYVVGEIYKGLTYKVLAVEIKVDGAKVAVVRNLEVADSLFDKIMSPFMQEGLDIREAQFVENVETAEAYVEKGDVDDFESAFKTLTATKSKESFVEVKQGDYLLAIAERTGISIDRLYEMNPGLNNDPTKLRAGQDLRVSTNVPALSVRTKELTEFYERVTMPVETRDNANEPKSYSRVVQQGREGNVRVTAYIVRVNGEFVGHERIKEVVVEEPITQITEVGTK